MKTNNTPPNSSHNETDFYFRRCHLCDVTTENIYPIEKCSGCGKHFAPFFFCAHPEQVTEERPPYPPIQGISLSWADVLTTV